MAFVTRSSKNLEEQIKPNNSFNFYENINLFTEINKKYLDKTTKNKQLPSFGTKSLRKSLNFKDGSESPGPGSYKLEKSILKKTFNQNLTSPNDPEGIEGEHTQLFISKEKRFKEYNKSNANNPCPGEYFKDKNIFEPNNLHKDISHLKNFGIYHPFSPKRQISIPTDDLYYEVKNDGKIEVKTDFEKYKNINKSLGPGSYDIKFYDRKNNSIDWSKTAKDKNFIENELNEKKNKKKVKNIKINVNDSFNETTSPYDDKTNNSTNLITHNIERLADKICNTEIISQKEKHKKLFNNKIENNPGPADYDTTFNTFAPIKFSNVNNFGSNSSRGLLYPLMKNNKIRIGLKNKKTSLIIKNDNNKNNDINNNIKSINKNLEENESGVTNNKNISSFKLHFLHVNNIKEKYFKNKDSYLSNLGPGTYNPSTPTDRNKNENYIQNFNSLEKRFIIKNKDKLMFPGVGTYSTIDSYSPKKSKFKSVVPHNISQRNLDGISAPKVLETKDKIYYDNHRQPCVGEYYPEIRNSIEYNMFKILNNYNNDKKPSFNYAEKRFFEPKRKYEDENQVGKYNLIPKEKELVQQNTPFSSVVERDGIKYLIPNEKKNNKHLGPGAYRYDSYFDWNKKTYNILFA